MISTRCFLGFFSKPQLARPETCCLRCWSSTPLNGYRWTRLYSTPTSTCGMIQLRWRRWVGLWQSCVLITISSSILFPSLNGQQCLLCICNGMPNITMMTLLIFYVIFETKSNYSDVQHNSWYSLFCISENCCISTFINYVLNFWFTSHFHFPLTYGFILYIWVLNHHSF